MELQTGIVLTIVAAALAYLLRYLWRTWQGKKAGCGCGTATCPAEKTNSKPNTSESPRRG